MSQTDPIGDFLTVIRNGSRSGKAQVDFPASRLECEIAEILKQEGFVLNWRKISEGSPQGVLRVYLKYTKNRKSIVRCIRRVSKPGLRIYVGKNRIPKVFSGMGLAILSTPKGLLTGAQAKSQGVGGEVICHVW
ncbi:MAG: 30S ribosomal protein S8 [Candidatus Omnitrophica bacterium]|nr:30S ribosomal protein S8 [Candidatus Omnitrophota bacterium]